MRIDGLPEKKAGFLTRLVYRKARRRLGTMPEPLAVTAHNGWILTALCGFESAIEKALSVDLKIKELVQIKAASLVGCPW